MATSKAELSARARRVKLVLTDCDGVLTDAGVYYSDEGEQMKRFSLRDGMGVERLRNVGVQTAIITREKSGAVARRAEKLKLPHVYLGVWDKKAHLDTILSETGYALSELAYIGDDVNDLGIIHAVREQGLTGAPADAFRSIKDAVHYVCDEDGGHGAFRDFAEWILSLREGEPTGS